MSAVELPAAARRVESKAREAGWQVITESFVNPVTGTAVATLRLRREADRLVAVWVDGRFDSAWQKWWPTQPEGGVSPRRLGARQLVAVVTG